jgi:hypothetical protein
MTEVVLKDRVKEISTTIGTGSMTLDGAVQGFQSFAAIGNGNLTFYTIANAADWEVGIGMYLTSGPTLERNVVLDSSNNGNKVNWFSGEKEVFVTYPSSIADYTPPSSVFAYLTQALTGTGALGSVTTFAPSVEYLVVAGGGGGSNYGGGGAGGYRTGNLSISTATNYTVTVAAGGTGGTTGANGGNSVFSTITSAGGGRGGVNTSPATGAAGGSGGGGNFGSVAGGAGNTPSVSPSQGNNGGTGGQGSPSFSAGGGGGAGAVGGNGVSSAPGGGGAGGDGAQSSITGTSVYYAGGGGGGVFSSPAANAPGGLGGGGTGGKGGTTGGTAGTANTGGGGGGAGNTPASGLSGGSGIVILRYDSLLTISNPGGGLTFSTSTAVSGFKITTFTAGTGNVQWSL